MTLVIRLVSLNQRHDRHHHHKHHHNYHQSHNIVTTTVANSRQSCTTIVRSLKTTMQHRPGGFSAPIQSTTGSATWTQVNRRGSASSSLRQSSLLTSSITSRSSQSLTPRSAGDYFRRSPCSLLAG